MIDLKKENLKKFSTPLRIIIGVGLITILVIRLDLNKILSDIGHLNVIYLVYALAVYFLFIVISTWRWQVLLDFKKFNIPFTRTLVIYFIAQFFNHLLPTQVGGDVMRVYYTMKGRKADSLATVLVDRILGFVGLFVFLAMFVIYYFFYMKKQPEFLVFIVVGLVIMLLITYVFFSEKAYSVLSPLLEKIKLFRIGERLNRLHEAATDFGGAWGAITLCVIHSIIIQALLALAPFLVMRGMGHYNIGILPFFIYLPIVNVISMIPISPGALGVRENAYVFLFSREGLVEETAFAVSLISAFLIFVLSIIGGLFFVIYKKR